MKYSPYILTAVCLGLTTIAHTDNIILKETQPPTVEPTIINDNSQQLRFNSDGTLEIRSKEKIADTNDYKYVTAPGRLFVARDWRITLENASSIDITITGEYADGKPIEKKTVKAGDSIGFSSEYDQNIVIEGGSYTQRFTILAARKLKAITKIGAGFAYNAGDDYAGYQLVDKVGNPGTKVIQKTDQRNFNGNLTGQIYLPFDDEAWLANPGVAKALTFGMYNPSHHRIGLMAGIATKEDIDPTYQIGICWLLDREGTAVLSYGMSFRSRNVLLQGLKEGNDFAGDTLPTRKEFKPFFFIGVSFNIGG